MRRLTNYAFCRGIEAGFARVSPGIRGMLAHVDFWCGGDPIFAGLFETEMTFDGRSYRDTACYLDGELSSDGRATVVIPRDVVWMDAVVVHELGHALDYLMGKRFDPVHAVTDYAAENREERFAEWFTEWFWRDWNGLYILDEAEFAWKVTGDRLMTALMGALERDGHFSWTMVY